MNKRVVIFLLALAVGGLAVVLWPLERAQRATMADGTELTLLGATFGKEHRYVVGGVAGRFQAWLARQLRPLKVTFKTPPQLVRSTRNDAVTFWFHVRLPNAGVVPYFPLYYFPFYVVEDKGIGVGRFASYPPLSLSATDYVVSVTFESFPRRRREVVVERELVRSSAAANAPGRPPAQFRVSNRLRHQPAWQPSPLPVLARNQGIDFSLERLLTGVSFSGGSNRATGPGDSATLAEFRVVEGGMITTNWQPVQVEASDAAGDISGTSDWHPLSAEGRVGMIFQDALWTEEPAWKLRVEFSRTAGFAPEELWTTAIPDVPAAIAARGDGRFMTQKTFGSGWTVSVPGLQPAGQPGVSCEVRIRVSPEPRDVRLSVVKVADPARRDGRPIESRLFARASVKGAVDYVYNLYNVGDARSLEFTLALHPSRYVEFLAKAQPAK